MGTSESSAKPVGPEKPAGGREGASSCKQPARSLHTEAFRRLHRELSQPDHFGHPLTRGVFQNCFENYFGGPYLELGQLLYRRLLGNVVGNVEENEFVSKMSHLELVSGRRGQRHEAEAFYFSVFAEGSDVLDEKGLTDMIHIAATFSMVVGSELHDQAVLPRDHFIIQAMLASAWQVSEDSSRKLNRRQFGTWVSSHCPRLLEGLQQWVLALLLTTPHQLEVVEQKEKEKHGVEGEAPHSSGAMALHLRYQLPTPSLKCTDQTERQLELQTIIWALSTSLPLIYLGHREDEKMHTSAKHEYPIGGRWTLLYSSAEHGFSMNRFQHHCSDYREPSVMLLTCRSREGGEGKGEKGRDFLFAVAVDTEWRDGAYMWGGEKFYFIQLQPTFLFLTSGPKQISLNEKKRGFPTGLRVMSSSDGKGSCLLEVDSALELAHYEGGAMGVVRVEVWGCGGEMAAESQRRMKEWEKKEILRRRKIKASNVREMWSDSPDRYLLELGGVTTRRPAEQHQQ